MEFARRQPLTVEHRLRLTPAPHGAILGLMKRRGVGHPRPSDPSFSLDPCHWLRLSASFTSGHALSLFLALILVPLSHDAVSSNSKLGRPVGLRHAKQYRAVPRALSINLMSSLNDVDFHRFS
jgi:hypothetical protein